MDIRHMRELVRLHGQQRTADMLGISRRYLRNLLAGERTGKGQKARHAIAKAEVVYKEPKARKPTRKDRAPEQVGTLVDKQKISLGTEAIKDAYGIRHWSELARVVGLSRDQIYRLKNGRYTEAYANQMYDRIINTISDMEVPGGPTGETSDLPAWGRPVSTGDPQKHYRYYAYVKSTIIDMADAVGSETYIRHMTGAEKGLTTVSILPMDIMTPVEFRDRYGRDPNKAIVDYDLPANVAIIRFFRHHAEEKLHPGRR